MMTQFVDYDIVEWTLCVSARVGRRCHVVPPTFVPLPILFSSYFLPRFSSGLAMKVLLCYSDLVFCHSVLDRNKVLDQNRKTCLALCVSRF